MCYYDEYNDSYNNINNERTWEEFNDYFLQQFEKQDQEEWVLD